MIIHVAGLCEARGVRGGWSGGDSSQVYLSQSYQFNVIHVIIDFSRYGDSQHWPFPSGSIMIGCHAIADPGQTLQVGQ